MYQIVIGNNKNNIKTLYYFLLMEPIKTDKNISQGEKKKENVDKKEKKTTEKVVKDKPQNIPELDDKALKVIYNN